MASRNYEGATLHHKSFRNQPLDHARFHDADLAGADFTGADLHDADLRGVHTGMSPRWKLVVITTGLLASVVLGVIAGFVGRFVVALLDSEDLGKTIGGVLLTSMLLVFVVVAVWRGIRYALTNTLPPFAAVLLVSAGYILISGVGTGRMALEILGLLVVLALAVGLGGAARALAGTAGTLGFAVAAIIGALTGALLGGGLLAAIVAIGAVVVGQLSLRKREGFDDVERAVVTFSIRGGTKFRDADLRGARFDDAELRACDFRGARLDDDALRHAKDIRLCIFDEHHVPEAGPGAREAPPPPPA